MANLPLHINKPIQKIRKDKLNKEIRNIFFEVQDSIKNNNIDQLSNLFTLSFFKRFKKQKKLFMNNEKVSIDNIKLQDITNFKFSKQGVTVDIIFSALTHTKHDKNTVHWRIRKNYSVYFPNKEFGEETVYEQYFKQRWFFIYESKILKINKIKGIYIKQAQDK
ncbi:hypothetical protein [Lactococcus garvieae]|uniref:hypothetical protein n=1 Tax=Lactococcus garvieae TaxID=1363 RepID=UPI00051F9A11|nr:hypothetical protein [Lactococcus garvieae]MBS4465060.1 hypothetical protein [Lactococcus garvieae]QQB43202.1 hypothetical protein I6H59_00370 [Lactococcus garvieae]CEF52373.1 hypothetical protein LGMT14_02301 [Lactococcus garvieae]